MQPIQSRPLRTLFLLSSMPVGGAETLLVNLVRQFDRTRIDPMIACLKERDELGEMIAEQVPVFDRLIRHKYDFGVVGRLTRLMKDNQVDAAITVGAGDKMFWGRIAARQARLPVVLSALHSTGWPDGVGRMNRMLTGITDGFIAVARHHANHLVYREGFPAEKVFLVPNGIDTQHYQFDQDARQQWRQQLGIPGDAPVVGIVAALRPEKNHALFLEVARRVSQQYPHAHFVIAGDGPLRADLEEMVNRWKMEQQVHFLGSVSDVRGVLSMTDLFVLTSDNEASPVSIMEALSCQRPVVAPDVGSIGESVMPGKTGFLVPAGDANAMTERWLEVLGNAHRAGQMGEAGRDHVVANSSLIQMTRGYTELIEACFARKSARRGANDFNASNRDSLVGVECRPQPAATN